MEAASATTQQPESKVGREEGRLQNRVLQRLDSRPAGHVVQPGSGGSTTPCCCRRAAVLLVRLCAAVLCSSAVGRHAVQCVRLKAFCGLLKSIASLRHDSVLLGVQHVDILTC